MVLDNGLWGSDPTLRLLNTVYYPFYLAHKFGNWFEDLGIGAYGSGVIALNYPRQEDVDNYNKLLASGEVQRDWQRFMEEKWRPLFQRISEESNIAFDRVVLTSDYRHGKRTFLECKIFEELYNSIPPQPSLPLAIHGTNDPDCIGHKISGGCVRMHDRDIVELMGYVRIGMTVEII